MSAIRVRDVTVLSDDWYVLKKTTFDYQRADGRWQTMSRETYDRGNGAVALLYNREHGTVLLTRQFRYPAYVNGLADGRLIEACAGLLDGEAPAECIRREAEEETGYRIGMPEPVFEAFMSPGSVTEKLYFYVAEYGRDGRSGPGGGNASEGEEIEVLELPFARAMEMALSGEIQDGKTLLLLFYAERARIFAPGS